MQPKSRKKPNRLPPKAASPGPVVDTPVAPAEEEGVPPTAFPAAGDGSERKFPPKLVIRLRDDLSAPDWEHISAKTRERIREMFRHPSTAVELGLPADGTTHLTAPQEEAVFSPDVCGALYDALGAVEGTLAASLLRIPAEEALKIFSYSDEEKELLGEPTARVLNKRMPLWVKEYADEIALALLFVSVTRAKVASAVELKRKQAEEKRKVPVPIDKTQTAPAARTEPETETMVYA